jgi:hypothetical protein
MRSLIRQIFTIDWVQNHPAEFGIGIATLIVVLGLFVYGIGDLIKFSPRRVWAIGGVVFRESIRRKVLWLTPLVMLGIVALTGVQQPDDPLDAIRQTLQFSLFASGMLVVISAVMLSCTNLPRDIETKVIFTIVTKPTTRLEIILGKIIGFARVTGAILILMGVFTWSYVHMRAWQLGRDIAVTLSQPLENDFSRGRLEHLKREGLLDTRKLVYARQIDTVAKEAAPGSPLQWISTAQTASIPFTIDKSQLVPQGFNDPAKGEAPPSPGAAGVIVRVTMTALQVGKAEVAKQIIRGPMLPDDISAVSPYGEPSFTIRFSDTFGDFDIIPVEQINGGKSYALKLGPDGTATVDIRVDEKVAPALANLRNWSVVIASANENFLLGIAPGAVSVIVPGNGLQNFRTLESVKGGDGKSPLLFTRGGAGRSGRLLEGPAENYQPITIAHFTGTDPRGGPDGTVALELTMDIERLDDDSQEQVTQIEVDVANPSAGKSFEKIYLTPEKLKTVYADVPAEAFAGGTFDVKLRTMTRGHAIALSQASIAVVESRHSFGVNLAKALGTQWMLSALVVTIGTCCSTFLSWPIAIVTSIVVLMARWAVDQVSDSLQPGIGALLATDIGATNATQARVISTTFDGLARLLNFVAQFLPNIDQFSTAELVQRGLLIPMSAVTSAATVLALFGLPLLTFAYVVFRNKEVAP